MIHKVNIRNFKSLVDIEVSLSKLTLLAGINNSGKSSFIQAIRMYHQAYNEKNPYLKGYGALSDLRSKSVKNTEKIEIDLEMEGKQSCLFSLSENSDNYQELCHFNLLYIGADRLGPQLFLPLNTSIHETPTVGAQGEYTIDFIEKLVDAGFVIPNRLEHPLVSGVAFEYALKGWMTEIAPNVQFTFFTNKKADISSAEIDSYRPKNVGFGLSYTLPIVAAALGAAASLKSTDDTALSSWNESKKRDGILLIVENPEAHLHPKGQTAMGMLLAQVANCGVQVLIETHSEHVMDGIRIAVKQKLISHDDVSFKYFQKQENCSDVQTPELDPNGKLSFWPDGFFDQTLKNRAFLAKKD